MPFSRDSDYDEMPDIGNFATALGDVGITVQYQINADHKATATFSYLSRSYSFKMSKWSGKNQFTDFQIKFHQVYTDTSKFGSSGKDANGNVVPNTSPSQQTAIVAQAIQDVFRYLEQLLHAQQKAIIDYACWYRERHGKSFAKYEDYIQLVTTHCIVHSEFLAPNVSWNVTPFVV